MIIRSQSISEATSSDSIRIRWNPIRRCTNVAGDIHPSPGIVCGPVSA